MNILEMHDIHKSFNDLEVLKGIDLNVAKGEIVAVIGPSGGGKSTLLRCATTLERVDSGKIVIGGDVLCETNDGKIRYCDKKMLGEIRTKFGLVFQNFNLFPHFSVRRNITEALIHVHRKSKALPKLQSLSAFLCQEKHYRSFDPCTQEVKGRG